MDDGSLGLQQLPPAPEVSVKDLISGSIPPWVRRFVKLTGRSVNEYGMIAEGDRVLLGISGGKDSLALALALALRKQWLPVSYELEALHINWLEHPIPDDKRVELAEFFELLEIPFQSIDEHMYSEGFKGEFNCYLCSRNRRRILFDHARMEDFKLIGLGHHLDDLIETTLMNLCFRADFSTMAPAQPFFDGQVHIIRPMIRVHESQIVRLAQAFALPVVKPICPYNEKNIRSRLKPVIKELRRIDKLTPEHIFKAHHLNYRIPRSEYQDRR